MPIIEGTRKLGGRLSMGELKYAVAEYDFAVDGGAVGTIALRGDKIPSGAIAVDALLVVDTAVAGGTATDTLSLNSEAVGDIQAAAARSGAPWSTTGAKRVTLTATSAPVKTTAVRSIGFAINGTAITAGKFRVLVTYLELA